MKILIIGQGRMGQLIKKTAEAKGHEVIGLADIFNKDSVIDKKCDVVLDFSHRDNLSWVSYYCKNMKAALVYGTTGLEKEHLDMLDDLSKDVPVFYSSNFSYGVAVMRKLLQMVTPLLKEDFDMEMIETHHNQKADAPSGTAKMLLEAMDPNNEFKKVYGREGMVGKREKEIGVMALRGGTVAGIHEVKFFGDNETIEIKHIANNRQIFVNGAIKAAEFVVNQPAGLYNMDSMM
ncbi:MAG: 4-hydroxy-tetrahydrodipicolinate reductase [Faecalicoccus sp.]|nr:4-hydroxy-tetrahydrodipicolinate reductase [Faecalicoccus sp.]